MKYTLDQQIMAVEALRDRASAQHEVDMFTSVLDSLHANKVVGREMPAIMADLTMLEGMVKNIGMLAGTKRH